MGQRAEECKEENTMNRDVWPFGEGSELEESMGRLARILRAFYEALIREGFNEEQALQITLHFMKQAQGKR